MYSAVPKQPTDMGSLEEKDEESHASFLDDSKGLLELQDQDTSVCFPKLPKYNMGWNGWMFC